MVMYCFLVLAWRLGGVWSRWVGKRRAANIAAGIDPGTGSAVNVGYKPGGLEKMEGLPYAFGRFGYVAGTTFYYLAAGGYYWSGSTVSSERSFHLSYDGSVLYPAGQVVRAYGWSVRCVAR